MPTAESEATTRVKPLPADVDGLEVAAFGPGRGFIDRPWGEPPLALFRADHEDQVERLTLGFADDEAARVDDEGGLIDPDGRYVGDPGLPTDTASDGRLTGRA